MIVFDCPGCQAKLQVPDEHAGKLMRCPTCQHTATIPSVDASAVSAEPIAPAPPPASSEPAWDRDRAESRDRRDDDDRPRRRRRDRDDEDERDRPKSGGGMGVVLALVIGGVGVCFVGAILVALLLPAVQKVREAAARTQSMNNLKNIALGFHAFHDVNNRLPFNGADDRLGPQPYSKDALANSPTSGSWGFQILPHIDQRRIFSTVDRGSPVHAYLCPGRGRPFMEAGSGAWTDYFYNNYINSAEKAFTPDNLDMRRRFADITDGTGNTILVGHGNIATTQYTQNGGVGGSSNIFFGGTVGTMRSGNDYVRGAAPLGVTILRDSAALPGIGSWGGPFPQGGLMCMADGSVHMFSYQTPNFSEFLTPNGAEAVLLPN